MHRTLSTIRNYVGIGLVAMLGLLVLPTSSHASDQNEYTGPAGTTTLTTDQNDSDNDHLDVRSGNVTIRFVREDTSALDWQQVAAWVANPPPAGSTITIKYSQDIGTPAAPIYVADDKTSWKSGALKVATDSTKGPTLAVPVLE